MTVDTPIQSHKGQSNILNLTNLLLRDTPHRVTTIQLDYHEPDPELYVVTRVDWRDSTQPILKQLPRLLSILEVLRGTRSVPTEVYLDSTEGLAVYIRMDIKVSDIPDNPSEAISFLRDKTESTLEFHGSTVAEVERQFWRIARKKGFSPRIIGKIAKKEEGFKSRTPLSGFYKLLRTYFSLRFRIHTSENCLRVEG
ncbi:MAG: hypothetical protein ACXAAQ_13645 [Candidatus Thorarchaeota archaeon]